MKNRYIYLDGIRGLAALFVITRHTSHFWNLSFFRSYLAVDLFFILSGFVIASAYDSKIAAGTLSAREFMKIRGARLYPAFFLSLLLSGAAETGKVFALDHGIHGATALQLAASIMLAALFLPSWVTGNPSLFPMNGAYWSLFYELAVNVVYARLRRRLDDRHLLALALAAGGLLGIDIYLDGSAGGGSVWSTASFSIGIARSGFGIFTGIYLFQRRKRFQAWLPRRLPAWSSLLVVAAILASPSFGRYDGIADAAAIFIVFPFLVLIAARQSETRWAGVLIALGEASYPLYVFHIPLGQMLFFIFKNAIPAHAPLSGIAFLAVIVPASVVFARRYETPLRRELLRRISTPPAAGKTVGDTGSGR